MNQPLAIQRCQITFAHLMQNIRFIFVIFLTLAGHQSFAVVGGSPVLSKDSISDSLVNIKMQKGMCSGTLIAPQVVIAAAHCRDRLGPAEWVAKIGDGTTDPCDISEATESVFIPDAQQDLPFAVHNPDLLLIRLKSQLCHAKPATLDSTSLQTNEIVQTTGFGQGPPKYGIANKIEVKLIDFESALKAVSPMKDEDRELMFAGAKTFHFALPVQSQTSLCEGDSGGPVYREINGVAHLLGVNSAALANESLGASQCDHSYLQIFTPIAPYISAIRTQILFWSSELTDLVM